MIRQKIPSFLCSAHDEPLNLICLDQQCEGRGLICIQCEYEQHRHQVDSVGNIFTQMKKDLQSYESNLLVMSQIDENYHKGIKHSHKLKDQNQRKLLLQIINRYYKHLSQEITQHIQKIKQFFNLQNITQKELNRQLLSYKQQPKEQHQKHLSNLQISLINRRDTLSQAVLDLEEGIKASNSLDKLLNLFSIDDGHRIKYQFSSEKKNKDIIVEKYVAKMKDGYSYRIALLEPPIRKQNGKTFKKSVTFKVGKVSAIVGVGICYTKKVSDLNYVFSAYSQHGCYFVANNGYTYNQTNSQFNSQIKNWTFSTDETITVTVDPKDKNVHFRRDDSKFEFPYEEKPQHELSFGVLLCCADESVEIMNG